MGRLLEHRKVLAQRDLHASVLYRFLESGTVATHGSFSAGISELRWAPVSKAGSIHVVDSGKAPGQTGKTLLCVAVG